jgi:hypothetical protein
MANCPKGVRKFWTQGHVGPSIQSIWYPFAHLGLDVFSTELTCSLSKDLNFVITFPTPRYDGIRFSQWKERV